MLHRETYIEFAFQSLSNHIRHASLWISLFIKENYIMLLFVLMVPVMFSRIDYNPRSVIWSDAEGYYQYLPALFIIKDVHQIPPGSIWPQYNEQGEYIDKYTCGIAIFECPFFFAAYLFSYLAGIDPLDYYNPLYCRFMALCALLITFLGLRILRIALLKICSPGITAWVILSVFFGTNLFYYTTKEMSVSHAYSFSLFCYLLYLLPIYLKNPTRLHSILVGGILGWIVLIRPTNILMATLLLLYDVYSMQQLKERMHFYIHHYTNVFWMCIAAFIFFIPQMLYWKEMTGHWLYYSYTEEGFIHWNKPKIAAVLFDTQNGLFLYSPLALLMMAGIILGLRKGAFQAPVVLLIFSVATYLFASWWIWWFAGSFGHRCFVEFYALLAFPLAGLYQYIALNYRPVFRVSFFTLVFLLMVFSVRLSYLYVSLWGPWDGEEWRWAWDKYVWVLSHFFG